MTPAPQSLLYARLGLTERDLERVRAMVDEAAASVARGPGPLITAIIDLDAEQRVFCHQPGRQAPYCGTYLGTRHGWRIYAAPLTARERRDRKTVRQGDA